MPTASSVLSAWSNFYVITGSAAAGLTGLMFVVITLVTGLERSRRTSDLVSPFTTPTVVHFSVTLLASAALSAPWPSLANPAALLGLTGLFGVAYVLRVMDRTRRQTVYTPELADWIWYTIFPLVAYAAIATGAILLPGRPSAALFVLAGATMLLTFVGIHNAWDVVTYIAFRQIEQPSASTPSPAA